MADVNPGLAAQAENGATVIGVNPNAIVQEDVAPPRVERISRPGGPKTLPERWQEVAERVNELSPGTMIAPPEEAQRPPERWRWG